MMSRSVEMRLEKEMKDSMAYLPEFTAEPVNGPDGKPNLMEWKCSISGEKGTLWEGAIYKLHMIFEDTYPNKPPQCKFVTQISHRKVSPSGQVSMRLLKKDWNHSITVTQIILGIQKILKAVNKRMLRQVYSAFQIFALKYTLK